MGRRRLRTGAGGTAGLVLRPGEAPIEPIVTLPAERTVIKAGRVVAVNGSLVS